MISNDLEEDGDFIAMGVQQSNTYEKSTTRTAKEDYNRYPFAIK